MGMAVIGAGSVLFDDDVTTDRGSQMNSDMYRAILSDQIQLNAAELIGPPSQGRWTVTQNIVQKPGYAAGSLKLDMEV